MTVYIRKIDRATREQIQNFEKENNISLDGYRLWLSMSDGGEIIENGVSTIQLFGVAHKPLIKTGEHIVIGKLSYGDSIILEEESVAIFNHEKERVQERFNNLSTLLSVITGAEKFKVASKIS